MLTPSSKMANSIMFPPTNLTASNKPTVQQYYEQIVLQSSMLSQPQKQQSPTKQILKSFLQTNRQIHKKIQLFNKLTQQYKQKLQHDFFISFTKILQKMSNDLILAEQAYKNIDKEIMTKQRCINLNNDKLFFIEQSAYYKSQLQFRLKEVEVLKEKNFLLIKENTGIKENLFRRIKENMFYKQKCKKLERMLSQANKDNKNVMVINEFTNENVIQEKQEGGLRQSNDNLSSQKFRKMNQSLPLKKSHLRNVNLGMQTPEQRAQIQRKKSEQKGKLLFDIKKQLKQRDKKLFNLQQVLNRSVNLQKIQQKPIQKQSKSKNMKVLISNKDSNPQDITPKFLGENSTNAGSPPFRISKDNKNTKKFTNQKNSQTRMNTTFTSGFKSNQLSKGVTGTTQRSIHTSARQRNQYNRSQLK